MTKYRFPAVPALLLNRSAIGILEEEERWLSIRKPLLAALDLARFAVWRAGLTQKANHLLYDCIFNMGLAHGEVTVIVLANIASWMDAGISSAHEKAGTQELPYTRLTQQTDARAQRRHGIFVPCLFCRACVRCEQHGLTCPVQPAP